MNLESSECLAFVRPPSHEGALKEGWPEEPSKYFIKGFMEYKGSGPFLYNKEVRKRVFQLFLRIY